MPHARASSSSRHAPVGESLPCECSLAASGEHKQPPVVSTVLTTCATRAGPSRRRRARPPKNSWQGSATPVRAAMIYQHAARERDKSIAAALGKFLDATRDGAK